jgi:hypothetical protein
LLFAEELILVCGKFASRRDKLRQSRFFAREGIATSSILEFSPRSNRLAP